MLDFGVVGYAKDFSDKAVSDRVGDNPLIIKATAKNGAFDANAVVADEDAKRIIAADRESDFLKNLFKIS